MKKIKKQTEEIDDGRVIAPMNVEGMPWHTASGQDKPQASPKNTGDELSAEGKRAFTWGVLKAVLLISTCFIGLYALFLWFCTNIWFK